MPRPYYTEPGVTIYNGDARDLIAEIEAETIITDPVWPNCEHVFPGIDARRLLGDALHVARVDRVVLQLGFDSDPRFLLAVPDRWPFMRVCYLEYARVGYKGRFLRDADVAYTFGSPPPSKVGGRVLPGRYLSTRSDNSRGWGVHRQNGAPEVVAAIGRLPHPAMRNIQHLRWLVKWFAGASVLDPFGGSGTTAVACKALGIPCTLIEIEERYCDLAVRRLRQGSLFDSAEQCEPETADMGRL